MRMIRACYPPEKENKDVIGARRKLSYRPGCHPWPPKSAHAAAVLKPSGCRLHLFCPGATKPRSATDATPSREIPDFDGDNHAYPAAATYHVSPSFGYINSTLLMAH